MNILIVDDHSLFRAGLEKLLSSMNETISAIAVGNLDEFEVLKLNTSNDSNNNDLGTLPDLVLLDYHIPGHDPLENILTARRLFPLARTVLISAETQSDVILNAIEHGVSGFIPKHTNPDVLIAALELVMAGGVYLPQEISVHYQAQSIDHALQKDSTPRTEPNLARLSLRQRQVLKRAIKGLSNQQIANDLGITIDTVKAHLSKSYRTLQVNSRTQALLVCKQLGGLE